MAEVVGKKRKRPSAELTVAAKRKKKTRPCIITIYTDGSCLGNNRKDAATRSAGYGIFYGDDDERNVSKRLRGLQTNNRAEMQAIIEACERHADERDTVIEIITDSIYCKNVVTKWMAGWKRRGWRKADGKEPLNLDMVKRLHGLMNGGMCKKPVFTWVKGHAATHGNEEADRLANEGALLPLRKD